MIELELFVCLDQVCPARDPQARMWPTKPFYLAHQAFHKFGQNFMLGIQSLRS